MRLAGRTHPWFQSSPLRLISSQVHSTTLPPLLAGKPATGQDFSRRKRSSPHIGTQHLRHRHAAVGFLLVVLQHRHQRGPRPGLEPLSVCTSSFLPWAF